METADTGLPIHQTKNVLIPRASHNFEFFAEVCQQMNGKTYPVDDKMLNYTWCSRWASARWCRRGTCRL